MWHFPCYLLCLLAPSFTFGLVWDAHVESSLFQSCPVSALDAPVRRHEPKQSHPFYYKARFKVPKDNVHDVHNTKQAQHWNKQKNSPTEGVHHENHSPTRPTLPAQPNVSSASLVVVVFPAPLIRRGCWAARDGVIDWTTRRTGCAESRRTS